MTIVGIVPMKRVAELPILVIASNWLVVHNLMKEEWKLQVRIMCFVHKKELIVLILK